MVLGDDVSTLETFVWILNHVSRSITWFLFALKAWDLVKWLILTWSLIWWDQSIDWLQFETRPSSPLNFGMAYVYATCVAGCSLCKTEDKQVNLQANHSCLGVDRLIFVGVHGWFGKRISSSIHTCTKHNLCTRPLPKIQWPITLVLRKKFQVHKYNPCLYQITPPPFDSQMCCHPLGRYFSPPPRPSTILRS